MKLSKRLTAVADMVTAGHVIADIGTDHGFIPIQLIKTGKCPRGFAMDIGQGPLDRAIEHVDAEGLNNKIECRLSDGFDKLNICEADTAVIAGMGGDLIASIITSKPGITKEIVASPHTHPELVRKALHDCGYSIIDENMIEDMGKFYVIIKGELSQESDIYTDLEYLFGKILLERKNTILKQFLEIEKKRYKNISQKEDYLNIINNALELMR